MSQWTDEDVALITELWGSGLSCRQIAKRMGRTRNAIIGKAHRLHLHERLSGWNPFGLVGRGSNSKPKSATPKPKKIKPQPVEFTADTWEPLAWATPVTLEHVTGCLWPASDPFAPVGSVDLFCNCKPVEGKSYCAEHQARSVGNGTVSEQTAVRVARHYGNQELREAA